MRRLASALAAFFLVVTVGAVASAAPADARGLSLVRPGHSIQAAIDAADPGDTIIVRPGTYHENLSITTNGIKLVGWGATLLPPATPKTTPCDDPTSPGPVNGICIIGDVTQGPNGPVVNRQVRHVTIAGLAIKRFSGIGIFSLGSNGLRVVGTQLIDNGEYGVFANTATNSLIAFNRVRNSEEAGIYVGDSPQANARVIANDSGGSQFGVFVRNAEHGTIAANRLHDNCVGALFLGDAPGPAGDFTAFANVVSHNNKACPPGDEGGPPTSGIGFAVASAHDVSIKGNLIRDNRPSADVPFSGGVVVIKGDPAGTAPSDNTVKFNVALGNSPDLFFDGSGTGNTFSKNVCRTSTPSGLCSRF